RRFFMHINARTVMSSRKIRHFLPQERSIIMYLYDLYIIFAFGQKMNNLFQDALFSAFAALIFELSTELSTDSVDKIFPIFGNSSTRRLTLHFIAKVNLF